MTDYVWTLPHDWNTAFTERLEWSSQILKATAHGTEQRRQMRLSPIRTFETSMTLGPEDFGYFEGLLAEVGTDTLYFPVMHEQIALTEAASVGATSLAADTEYSLYPSGFAIVCNEDGSIYELVEVSSVGSGSITLSSGTAMAWSAGSLVFPAAVSYVSEVGSASAVTDSLWQVECSLYCMEKNDYDYTYSPANHVGYPVFEFDADWSEPPDLSFLRDTYELDSGFGIKDVFDESGVLFTSRSFTVSLYGREEYRNFVGLLYALSGRTKSIWVPTLTSDLSITADSNGPSGYLVVSGARYTELLAAQEMFSHIMVEMTDGTKYYRGILSSSDLGDGLDQLNLGNPISETLSPSTVRRVCFLVRCRLDQDSIELTHGSDFYGTTSCKLTFTSAPEPEVTTPTLYPGQITFSSDTYEGFAGSTIAVSLKRVDGRDGETSATVEATDGTAVVGTNYQDVEEVVSWEDGYLGTLTIPVKLMPVESDNPYWDNVVLQIRGHGTTGASADGTGLVEDEAGHIVRTQGGVEFAASISPEGGGCLTFVEDDGCILYVYPNDDEFAPGTDAFTIQFYCKPNSTESSWGLWILIGQGTRVGSLDPWEGWSLRSTSGGGLLFQGMGSSGSVAVELVASGVLGAVTNTNHIEISRDLVGNWELYVNGVLEDSATETGTVSTDNTYPLALGNQSAALFDDIPTYAFPGKIELLQITKGVKLHSSNFTPPTSLAGPGDENYPLEFTLDLSGYTGGATAGDIAEATVTIKSPRTESNPVVVAERPHKNWRLYITGTTTSRVGIADLSMAAYVNGPNQCTGGTPTASSTYTGRTPSQAFDYKHTFSKRVYYTDWLSDGVVPQWLAYTFAEEVYVKSYTIRFPPDNKPTAWELQYSDDGDTWYTADSRSGVSEDDYAEIRYDVED